MPSDIIALFDAAAKDAPLFPSMRLAVEHTMKDGKEAAKQLVPLSRSYNGFDRRCDAVTGLRCQPPITTKGGTIRITAGNGALDLRVDFDKGVCQFPVPLLLGCAMTTEVRVENLQDFQAKGLVLSQVSCFFSAALRDAMKRIKNVEMSWDETRSIRYGHSSTLGNALVITELR